jgi:5-methylcytosine-specific restriction endonuclease McrA
MLKWCSKHGRYQPTAADEGRCPTCRAAFKGGRSKNRDRSQQAAFRRAVLARSGGVCEVCGSNVGVQAHHKVPLSRGGSYDPSNGVALCPTHHLLVDRYARKSS